MVESIGNLIWSKRIHTINHASLEDRKSLVFTNGGISRIRFGKRLKSLHGVQKKIKSGTSDGDLLHALKECTHHG